MAHLTFPATTTSSMIIRDVCLRTEAKLVFTSDMGAKMQFRARRLRKPP